MNERIKELARQCGMNPISDMSKFGMAEDMNAYNCQGFMLERFAELIVKECADLFDKNETEVKVSEHRIHNSIMVHFGLY